MIILERSTILGLALSVAMQVTAFAKPTIFDFYEYQQRIRAESTSTHEHPWLRATVRAVDRARRRIRITHVPAPALGIPAMTMTLDVAANVDFSRFKVGTLIELRISKLNGSVKITDVRMRGSGGRARRPSVTK